MAKNDFKPFATGSGANVMSQTDWEALPALLSGFTAGKASSAQVNKAVRQATTIAALVGQFIANSGVDALDNADVNGLVTKFTNALISNLRLGAGAPAIGIPFFWPSSAMPNTVMTEWADMVFLKFNGATFSATTYPKLALVFPGLVLPESRGEFLRIWDDGRGVDAGRTLLSAQAGSVIRQSAGPTSSSTSNPANVWDNDSFDNITSQTLWGTISATTQVAGGRVGTARPRNVAFNFLVRAK